MGRGRSRAEWRQLGDSRSKWQRDPSTRGTSPPPQGLISPFLLPAPLTPHPAPGTSLCQHPPRCSLGVPGAPGWPGPAVVGPPALVGHQHLWGGRENKDGCQALMARPPPWGPRAPPVVWGMGDGLIEGPLRTRPQQLGRGTGGGGATEPGKVPRPFPP